MSGIMLFQHFGILPKLSTQSKTGLPKGTRFIVLIIAAGFLHPFYTSILLTA
jgi:hypothetical protein